MNDPFQWEILLRRTKIYNMKKVLFLGVLSLLFVSLFSCNDDDDDKGSSKNLAVETKRLKVEAVGNQSLFDPVKFVLNIPVGTTIEDETFGDVKFDIDSAAFFHRNDTGAVQRISGDLAILTSDTLEFKTSARLFLNESYYFYVYCSFYNADGSQKIKENGSNAVISRWAKYVPTVVAGEDVIFSSTMNGSETEIINPYKGDMIVDFKVPVLFDASKAANSEIALLYRNMSVTSNSGSEYVDWVREDDTANVVFQYNPIFPEDKVNMIGGVYYTINLQFDYLVKENGTWKHMMNSNGDTAIWNYNKAYKTDELFVPKDIVTAALPAEGIINIDSIPTFVISDSHLSEVEKSGIKFRPNVKVFELNDGKRTYSNYKWLTKDANSYATADSVVVMLDLDSLLLPSTSYNLSFVTNWQFKNDTAWFDIIEEDTVKREIFNIEVATTNPSPGKQTFVSVVPSGDEVHMDADINCTFISELESEVDVNGFKMRSNIESFKLYQGSTIISESYTLSEDKTIAAIELDSLLIPTTEYKAVVLAYWEYLDINNSWKRVTQDAGSYYVEGDTVEFTTFGVPGSIVKSIDPVGARVDLNKPFVINLIGANKSTITKEGIEFRPVFLEDALTIKKDDVAIKGSVAWNTNNDAFTFTPDSMLYAKASYSVATQSYWEYKDGDTWKPVMSFGEIRYENLAKVIKTVEYPEAIISSISPSRTGTALTDTVMINLNRNNGEEYDFGGTKFKIVLEDPVVVATNNEDTVTGTYSWLDNANRIMIPSTYLSNSTSYTTTVRAYWMYLRNGKWFKIGDESRSVDFATSGTPGALISSIIPAGGVVAVDSLPLVTMGGGETAEFNGINFKRVVDEFKLISNEVVVDSTFTYSGTAVTLNNVLALDAGTDYSITFTAHWIYQLADNSWVTAVKEDGSEFIETRNVTFSTEE